jgi:tetratricopeptide (TPR) repeat protein
MYTRRVTRFFSRRPIRWIGVSVLCVMPSACAFCIDDVIPPQAVENNTFCAQYMSEGLLDQAEARCKLALEYTGGKYAEPWNNLGQIAIQRGHLDIAAENFKRAISLKEDFAEAHNNLGFVFLQQSDNAAAADQFKQATEFDPGYQVARRNYATALMYMGKPEDARDEYLKCVELDPLFCDCRMGLGVLALGQGSFDDAQGHFQKHTEVCPNDANGYYNLCFTYMKKQLCAQAVDACVAAVAINKDYIEAKKNLTEAYECMALQGGAISKYLEEIAKNPGDPEPHFRLGTVYEEQKINERALNEFLNSIRLSDGKHKLAHYRAARVYDAALQADETIDMCQRFVDLLRNGELEEQREWCVNRVKELQFR